MRELEILKVHEGFRSKVYKCSQGKNTIGYGLNLDAGIDEGLAEIILNYQIMKVKVALAREYNFYKTLNPARQFALANLAFNIGINGFRKFKRMIAALNVGDMNKASDEIIDSKYATQVGQRAIDLAHMLRSGNLSIRRY